MLISDQNAAIEYRNYYLRKVSETDSLLKTQETLLGELQVNSRNLEDKLHDSAQARNDAIDKLMAQNSRMEDGISEVPHAKCMKSLIEIMRERNDCDHRRAVNTLFDSITEEIRQELRNTINKQNDVMNHITQLTREREQYNNLIFRINGIISSSIYPANI